MVGKAERGFTLVELLIAITIMSLTALAIYPMVTMGVKARKEIVLRSDAFNYARQQLETKARDYRENLDTSTALYDVDVERGFSGIPQKFNHPNSKFTFADQLLPGKLSSIVVKKLTVTVEYDNPTTSTGRSILILSTLVTPKPVAATGY